MTTGPTPPSEGSPPSLSVILATLNERENLPELLDRIFRLDLPPVEVIVVDDGSVDGTREFVVELSRREPRLRTIFHAGKQTTLRAQCQGIEVARGEWVIVMDADLQHPPERIPAMVRELKAGAALVVASRYAADGSPGRRTMLRRVISRGAENIAKLLLPEARRVTDPVSGFFGFRRENFRTLNPLYRGYKLLLFVLVMNHDRPSVEVGFHFEPRTRGTSKVTQTFKFIRFFLVETILAQRFARTLRSHPGLAARLPTRSVDVPSLADRAISYRDRPSPGGDVP